MYYIHTERIYKNVFTHVTIYLYSIERLITKFVMYNCEIINFARYKYFVIIDFVTYKFCDDKMLRIKNCMYTFCYL
jgi:hypothetical protein